MSDPIKSTIYCYAFNLKRFAFSYVEALTNFCAFSDEVICATIKDEDDSPALLHTLALELPNLHIVETDISLSDNRFDGRLKTEALKRATNPIRIIADLDERFILAQKPIWQNAFANLLSHHSLDGILVPVLDLWGSPKRIRSDQHIGQKFRFHKDTVVKRDVIPQAVRPGGLIDTSLSDTTEPCLRDGNLARFTSLTPSVALIPTFARALSTEMYVVHEGFLDLKARVNINKEFWKKKWEERSGKREKVVVDETELKRVPTVEHGLPIR